MYLRTRLVLTLGGLIASILVVSGAGSIATDDLADRIKTVDQAAALSRHLDKIERSRRFYQISGSPEALSATRQLIAEASDEITKLKSMSDDVDVSTTLIVSLEDSFERYRALLGAYDESEARKSAARAKMATELADLQAMATELKEAKESDYHRTFAVSTSIKEAEERLKTTLRLTALANEIIVVQMSIERAVALFTSGDPIAAADIPVEIGRLAEIADRIRRIETVAAEGDGDQALSPNLPDLIAARSNQFQSDFDDFRLAARNQTRRAQEMAAVAIEVTQQIQKINALQTDAAVKSSDWTLGLSLLGVVIALVFGAIAVVVVRNRIILPLTAITETMRQVSAGKLTVAIPGHQRQDELGAMARALEVFRQNSLEARRLAEENLDVERRLAEEKAEAAMLEQSLEHEKELNAQQRRFVSLVSHEFRTPLAIIDGQAQRMIRKGDNVTVDKRAVSLEKIRGAVVRVTDLMESVLSSASLEAGSIAFNPTPMDLRALVKRVCENQQEISSTHRINMDIEALPEAYLGDPKLLNQVGTNLLSNAVKYSPEADRVDVTGKVTDDGLEIAVRDYGVGIPEDELPKLSQRFFRASTSTGIQGTGIGLNLVKSLVDMHDGTLEVTSIQGEGSTFTVKLPLKPVIDEAIAAVA